MNCCKIHYNQRRNEARWRLATGVEFILSTFGTGAHCLWCRCGLSRVQVSTLSCASEHSVGCRWTLHQMQVSTLSCASEHSVGCRWALCWMQVSTPSGASEHSVRTEFYLSSRDKKQVWLPRVRTWCLSEANVVYWRKCLWHWDFFGA